ncbi:MAG TPA: DUF2461 domain-containing protein [Acidimicrobiales bacterium]|nr:DUF2461 domain-containing protein [Acidimicrobiales bacterium]
MMFSPKATRFFEQLAADNTKAFWTEHKAEYDEFVRAPMVALTDELAKTYGPFHIFRPNRDIRFSKDKTPYKTNIAATAETEGGASVYVSFSADGLYAGTGYYRFAKDQIERYRAAVANDGTGAALVKLVAAARQKGYEVHGESLKVAPRGYAKDHPRVDLLRHAGLYVGRVVDDDKVKASLRGGAPVAAWLDEHVGPTTILPEDWRR